VLHQCSFAARCPWVGEECRREKPQLIELGGSRSVACLRRSDIAGEMAKARTITADESAIDDEPAGGDALVAVRDLRVTFVRRGRKGNEVQALKGISLAVRPGESVGLVGESGSGKTTTGRSLVGLVEPTSGSIRIDGIDASSYARASKSDRARLHHLVQIVFQDPYSSLNPARSIGAAVAEALSVRLGHRPSKEEIAALLRRVRLPASYADRKPAALSGGERQRVAIARAIAVEPRLLICDEPVSALDVSVQAQILSLLRDLREELGLALLFVTHDLAVVRQIADRIYVMYRGEVVESGPTRQILDAPRHDYTKRLIASIPGAQSERPKESG
jgi:peptide/nickel transport system ATP-binding protein